MKDDLSPRERMKAIKEGRPIDRLPNFFTIEDVASKVLGVKVSEFHLDPKIQVEATVASYERFELDIVETRLISAMNETCPGNHHQLHICGNTSRIWEDMVETGAPWISVDNAMDLADVKAAIGGKVSVVGNVKPTETMLLGSPGDVEEDLKSCLRKAGDAEKPFVPAYGCGLPLGTPIENLDAVYEAHRNYARPEKIKELIDEVVA